MKSSDESANSARTKSSAAPTFHSLPYKLGTAVTAIHLEKNLVSGIKISAFLAN